MLTMEQTVPIATLLNTHLEEAVAILATAFGDSPLARYCFADQRENRDRAVRAYARLAGARRTAAGGRHLVAFHDERPVAVVGIAPPESAPLPTAILTRWSWFAALVGPQAAARIEAIERVIERHRPSAPHSTLGALGILPAAQDRGAERALLDMARDYATFHPATTGIYAVAVMPEGVAHYERAGYRVVGREAVADLTISCLFQSRAA
jgi:GNAT superfamily N-acetyltransferase